MTQAPKGTHDIYGDESRLWRRVEDEIRALTDLYGYGEIRTPLFENTDLFLRGVGDTTDIVQKEMYTFEDKGGRSLSLRPELTAGVVRAYIERGMHNAPQPTKMFYIGPCFRYEKPGAGRYRQHYQFGVEMFGAASPAAEAEIISLGHALLGRLGIGNVRLHINSIGCPQCRTAYNKKLCAFLEPFTTPGDNDKSILAGGGNMIPDKNGNSAPNTNEKLTPGNNKNPVLCGLCITRMTRNPLRVLDCKNPACAALTQNAPTTISALCGDCGTHFTTLQTLLTRMEIPYTIDPGVVRGLDYYTRTVFEFIRYDGGVQTPSVGGGGRYDGLISQLGGTPTPAAGFGMGIERLVLLLKRQTQPEKTPDSAPQIFIGHADAEGFTAACEIINTLRAAGIRAEGDPATRSVKAQMKYAGKINAHYTIIIGANELTENACRIKNMQTGESEIITLDELKTWRI